MPARVARNGEWYWDCAYCGYPNRAQRVRCGACNRPENTNEDDEFASERIMDNAESDIPRRIQTQLIAPTDALPIVRGYGIEVECNWSGYDDCLELAYALCDHLPGVTVTHPDDYLARLSNGWAVGEDGSCGAELKSPILYNGAGLGSVGEILQAMDEANCQTDRACGIHVHTDVRDWRTNPLPFKNLAALVARVEDAIWSVCPQYRRGGTYSLECNTYKLQSIARAESISDILRAWYETDYLSDAVNNAQDHHHGTRYLAANFHSAFFRGSLEWRYFPSTLDAHTVNAYIGLCVALTEYAAQAKRVRFKLSSDTRPDTTLRKLYGRQFAAICKNLPDTITRTLRDMVFTR